MLQVTSLVYSAVCTSVLSGLPCSAQAARNGMIDKEETMPILFPLESFHVDLHRLYARDPIMIPYKV